MMTMMLTRAMALRAKGYKVMQHLYWHSVSMLLNQMYYSITNVYNECKVSGVKPGWSLTCNFSDGNARCFDIPMLWGT